MAKGARELTFPITMSRNSVVSPREPSGAGDEREPDDKPDRKVGGEKPTPGEPVAGKLARRVRRGGGEDTVSCAMKCRDRMDGNPSGFIRKPVSRWG